MSRYFDVAVVAGAMVAGAFTGSFSDFFDSSAKGPVFVAIKPNPPPDKGFVEDMRSCSLGRGMDFDKIEPARIDHLAVSTLAHCFLALKPAQLCGPDARDRMIQAVYTYFEQRAAELRYLSLRDQERNSRHKKPSRLDDEQVARLDHEAGEWFGDTEIDNDLARVARGGFLSPDDFRGPHQQNQIKLILDGAGPTKKACQS